MTGDTTQRAWAASEDLILCGQYHAGVAIARIEVPTRTNEACISRVKVLIAEGLLIARGTSARNRQAFHRGPQVATAAGQKVRACLCCSREFVSEHAGHRLCGYCRSNAASESPFEAGYALRVSVRVRA